MFCYFARPVYPDRDPRDSSEPAGFPRERPANNGPRVNPDFSGPEKEKKMNESNISGFIDKIPFL
jgi:hypothetical protein